jgi:hypothetical protein
MGKTIVNNNIKLKSGGGLINEPEGLSIGSLSVIVPSILGENITVTDTPRPVFLGEGISNSVAFQQRDYNSDCGHNQHSLIYGANQSVIAFKTGKYQTRLTKLEISIFKKGNPSGDAVFSLYLADASHKPTGSALGTYTITASSLSLYSALTAVKTNIPIFINVNKDTEYCLVIKSILSPDSNNCLVLYYGNSGESYLLGKSTDAGDTWTVSTSVSGGISVIGYSDYEEGKIYLSDFTDKSRLRINGFITESKQKDETYDLYLNGKVSGFSNLVTGAEHFFDYFGGNSSISNTTSGSYYELGTTTNIRVGQTITNNKRSILKRIYFGGSRYGSPTDALVVKLYNCVNGELIATSDINDLSVSNYFNFPDVILNKDAQYFFELERTGSLDNSNYYRILNNGTYSGGDAYLNRKQQKGVDLHFILEKIDLMITNNILLGLSVGKAISQSSLLLGDFKGIISVVNEGGSYTYGTSIKTFETPLFAKKATINFHYVSSPYSFKGKIEVKRDENVSCSDYSGSTTFPFNVSWSGNSMTITTANVSNDHWSAIIYYYN